MSIIAKFILTHKGVIVKKFSLFKGKPLQIIIGGDSNLCDVTIKDSYISKKHLAIVKDANDKLYIQDLHSTNGVYLNGRRIKPGRNISIKIGDTISFMEGSSIQLLVRNPIEKSMPNNSYQPQNNLPSKKRLCIGRDSNCDITINTPFASKEHAYIIINPDGSYTLIDNKSLNGTYINGRLLTGSKRISLNDKIQIGDFVFSLNDYLSKKISKDRVVSKKNNIAHLLERKRRVIIGRSPKADYVIKDNSVSRKHAVITKEANAYYIQDLGSVNGTFVNGKQIKKKTRIRTTDEIRISFEVIRIDGSVKKLSGFSAIRTENITKIFNKNKGKKEKIAVKPFSFSIPSKSFIALMGPSGCGKSTLMNMLNGFNPPTSGKVHIHGLELISNIQLIKQKVGFVPQDDIVHKNLTVNDALYYAAKLRMNQDTTNDEIWQRIDEVCNQLKIDKEKRKDKVSKLSGGQRKRVSIAVELLNKPSILFLDEPTSPLDPETIDSFLKAMRELTEKENTTVIMVTHKPSDLEYVDRVIFMGAEGYPAFYGDKQEMLNYFKVNNIIQVYSKLSKKNEAKKWYQRLLNKETEKIKDEQQQNVNQKVSFFKQFYWLAKRYAHIKINDLQNVALLLLQPLLIPLALVFIYDKLELGILFLMAITSIWFGVSNAAKEIVDELPIYIRERMYNLKLTTYLFSKIAILTLIAVIQIAIYVAVLHFSFKDNYIYLNNPMQIFGIMLLLTFSATLLGLLLSVIFKTSEAVMTIIPIVLIPQIIFAGVITKIDTKEKEVLSYLMYGRWGTEALARTQNDNEDFKTFKYKKTDSLLVNLKDDYEADDEMVRIGNGLYKVSMEDVVDNPETNKDIFNFKPIYKSVYQKIPDVKAVKDTFLIVNKAKNDMSVRALRTMRGDTLLLYKPIRYTSGEKYERTDPLDILGFYSNKKLLNKFDSLNMNIMAIVILDLIIFLLTLLYLKKKDKI